MPARAGPRAARRRRLGTLAMTTARSARARRRAFVRPGAAGECGGSVGVVSSPGKMAKDDRDEESGMVKARYHHNNNVVSVASVAACNARARS